MDFYVMCVYRMGYGYGYSAVFYASLVLRGAFYYLTGLVRFDLVGLPWSIAVVGCEGSLRRVGCIDRFDGYLLRCMPARLGCMNMAFRGLSVFSFLFFFSFFYFRN